ncbi:conjugative transposon TraM protein [Pedobacter sp. AK017]|uniref:conjugative transposon protein TraM n=1 Tax=Pedobacter sp. AK017 TaxID=2723073 RepID=UPI00160FD59F|nr:conjugative transposon protein TraM [Pedobacter sp. AK017]MBB5440649.1 conjugative transposon TraM protein [Pedobacter sp. AK017]
MKLNLKQPRYIIPLIMLPLLLIFSYVYFNSFAKEPPKTGGKNTLNDNVAGVSDQVKNTSLTDKMGALEQQHLGGDGYTAVGNIGMEQLQNQPIPDLYNLSEKRKLDSIDQAAKRRYGGSVYPSDNYGLSRGGPGAFNTGNPRSTDMDVFNRSGYPDDTDRQLALVLARMNASGTGGAPKSGYQQQADPMEIFRKQMAIVDSMGKANDPDYKAEKQRLKQLQISADDTKSKQKLSVSRTESVSPLFNTITSGQKETFIRAIVDQDITAYAGSRLRIRLLDDMTAGKFLIKRGAYLYAQISGFSGQRVNLTISTIMQDNHILPVKLEIYDLDGIPGLFVPASAFREFSKELGSDAGQGMTLQQQAENNNQLVMSVLQKMFQSTTTAVTKLIRTNKANIKYNTLVYLIDPDELKTVQKNY